MDQLSNFSTLTINMSAQTSSNNVQEIIEGNVEKRTKGIVTNNCTKYLTFLVANNFDLNLSILMRTCIWTRTRNNKFSFSHISASSMLIDANCGEDGVSLT